MKTWAKIILFVILSLFALESADNVKAKAASPPRSRQLDQEKKFDAAVEKHLVDMLELFKRKKLPQKPKATSQRMSH